MANLIGIYVNGTAGNKDGIETSVDRTFASPVEININIGESETVITPLAVRCPEGKNSTNVTLSTDTWDATESTWTGENDSMIAFSENEDGSNSQSALTISAVSDTNKIIYMVITSSDLQKPGANNLTSITISYTATEA